MVFFHQCRYNALLVFIILAHVGGIKRKNGGVGRQKQIQRKSIFRIKLNFECGILDIL